MGPWKWNILKFGGWPQHPAAVLNPGSQSKRDEVHLGLSVSTGHTVLCTHQLDSFPWWGTSTFLFFFFFNSAGWNVKRGKKMTARPNQKYLGKGTPTRSPEFSLDYGSCSLLSKAEVCSQSLPAVCPILNVTIAYLSATSQVRCYLNESCWGKPQGSFQFDRAICWITSTWQISMTDLPYFSAVKK